LDASTFLDGVISLNPSMDMAVDTDGRLLYVSPPMAKALGMSVDQLMGRSWGDLRIPDDVKESIGQGFRQVLDHKRAASASVSIPMEGGVRHYECTMSPILDGNGDVGNVVAILQDRTELEEERWLSAALDEMLLMLQSTYDIDRAIPDLMSIAVKELGADLAVIAFRQDEMWFPKYVSGDMTVPKNKRFVDEHLSLMNAIVRSKQVIELNTCSNANVKLLSSWGVNSMIAVPLHVRGEVFGVLSVAHKAPTPRYNASRRNFIRKLGAALSLSFSEDRYIWSRESDLPRELSNVGLRTMGMALLDENLEVISSDAVYDEAVPEDRRGGKLVMLSPYLPVQPFADEPLAALKKSLRSGRPHVHGCIVERMRNGVMVFWQAIFVPLAQQDGRDRAMCLMVDVTEWERSSRKVARLVTAMQQEQFQVRALMKAVPVGAYISDAEGHITEISDKAASIWGDVELPRHIEEYGYYDGHWTDTGEKLRTDDWPMVRAVRNGETSTGVINYKSFNGKPGVIVNSAAPIFNRQGAVVGAVEIDFDITEMKELEVNLEAAKAHLEAVIGQMPVGVAVAEAPTGRVISGNAVLGDMLRSNGRLPASIREYSQWNLLDPATMEPLPPEEHPLAKALKDRATVKGLEAVVRRADGAQAALLVSATPVIGQKGKVLGAVSVFTDISKQKELERRLEKQTRDLAKFNADLQRFAYVQSNDLRESLKTMTSYLDLLDKSSS